jgi:GNAT superfamily N-acetyltransferase
VPALVRPASDTDLDLLARIEDEADRRFVERFRPDRWESATSGRTRAMQQGFLLVATESVDGVPVGFAHVLEVEDAHLEQLAVLPEAGRRGHGRALVRAALAEADARGHRRLTLRTYADVPWNAPFYAALGFVESEPDTDVLRGLVETERLLGLERHGRRIQMAATTVARPR